MTSDNEGYSTVSDTTAQSAAETAASAENAQAAAAEAATAAQVTPADLAQAAQEATPDTSTPAQEADAGSDTPDIDALHKQIADLRKEAGKYRTRAKDAEAAKTTAVDDLTQKLGKALGLIGDEQQTPDDLIAAANKQAAEAQQQLAAYRRDAAIRDAANGKVSDTAILTALLNQDQAFTALDPTDADYATQVAAAVTAMVDAHPTLKAQAAASGVDTSTTSTGTDRKITREDLAKMTPHEINAAVKAGKLNHLMNKEQ